MGGRGTWLVVAALAALGIAAAVDTLRGGDSAGGEDRPPATTTVREQASGAADGPNPFGGTLYYTDEDCVLRAVRLDDLEEVEAPGWDECEFTLSPDARRASGPGSDWDPRSDPRIGRLFLAADGSIQLATERGPEGAPLVGTAPTWRPDGTLTYVRGGAVREWPSGGVLVPPDRLVRTMLRHPNAPADESFIASLRVRQLAWLDDAHLLVVLEAHVPEGADLGAAVVFKGSDVVTAVYRFTQQAWTSPRGTYFALLTGPLQLFERTGREHPMPPLQDVRAVAFSPDDEWMAVATRASVFVFRPQAPDAGVRRLPIVANDLEWRGDAALERIGPTAARAWLVEARATGRLLVTEPGCTLRALRLPALEWEVGFEVEPTPCRFAIDEDDGSLLPEGPVPQPAGGHVAVCRNGAVEVLRGEELVVEYEDACAPVWAPDGRLTFVRGGEIFVADEGWKERRLVSRDDIEEALGRPADVREAAWVDDRRLWAVLSAGGGETVALLSPGELALTPSFSATRIGGLRVSASGMVAARSNRGVVFLDTGGRRVLTFPGSHSVAWAPGELIAAVATPNEILFVAPISREVVSLPLQVEDLEWVVP